MTLSREQSRLMTVVDGDGQDECERRTETGVVRLLHRGNRFRLMFGQPFLPGDPGVERYWEMRKEREENEQADKPKQETTNE